MKLLIIGPPGAGKTYMAARLKSLYKLPVLHLDHIYWNESFTERIAADERLRRLHNFTASHDAWVIEGSYVRDWLFPVMDSADIVVLIDTSRILRSLRLARRSFDDMRKESIAGALRRAVHLQAWGWQYHRMELARIRAVPHLAAKLMPIRTKAQQRQLIKVLANKL